MDHGWAVLPIGVDGCREGDAAAAPGRRLVRSPNLDFVIPDHIEFDLSPVGPGCFTTLKRSSRMIWKRRMRMSLLGMGKAPEVMEGGLYMVDILHQRNEPLEGFGQALTL